MDDGSINEKQVGCMRETGARGRGKESGGGWRAEKQEKWKKQEGERRTVGGRTGTAEKHHERLAMLSHEGS